MAFADLVKAFDTSNHALLISILGKYGAPPRLRSAIKHMYDKSIIKLIIRKLETYIEFKVVVRKGDSMAPVLFLFLMVAFPKTLEDDWTALGLSKSKFARKDNSPRSTGQLVSHQPGTFSSGILLDLFFMMYVENGAFVFESRIDIEKGITLLSNHFAWFRLEMYIVTRKKPSKTECVIFPTPGFFNTRTILLTSLITSTFSVQKKESDKKRCICEDEEYAKCSETAIINVKGGFFTFTKQFKYLGSYTSFLSEMTVILTHA